MKFDSTSLPQTNTPVEIQKMGNDLLDKINKTNAQIATAIAAIPAAPTNFAPLPQTAAGVGQETGITVGSGANLVLPAGGIWRAYYASYNAATGTWNYWLRVFIGAGGTVIEAGVPGFAWTGVAWQIA